VQRIWSQIVTEAHNSGFSQGGVALRKCVNEADECYLADVEKPDKPTRR